MVRVFSICLLFAFTWSASGQIVISEWMYAGTDGEFIEFTNTGEDPVNMSGWSFDDDSQVPDTVDLSAFGIVQPGESVILTDAVAADFVAAWGLSGVSVIGELSANLGRNDQINLYDSSDVLVDQLSYGDEDYPSTPRTKDVSCNIPESGYGDTVAQTTWALSTAGDIYGSWGSSGGDIASPGKTLGYALSDFDEDSDVDVDDYAEFSDCLTGPGVSYDPLPAGCDLVADGEGIIAADADRDGDVDLEDFRQFQECFSGTGVPADSSCGYNVEPAADTLITLNGNSITVDGAGVTVDGTIATITKSGTFIISGTLTDGQIAVDAAGTVEMVFNGINIANSTSAPINVMNAGYVSIVLADQTQNYLADASTYVFPDPEVDEPSGALFSDDSMMISGTGTLTVQANYNDAIVSKDELIIQSGTINVTSVDDGIRGKDYLYILGGTINAVTAGDAIKSDNEDDPELGYITIEGGTFDIEAGGDGFTAETSINITGGDFTIETAGGHNETISEDLSAKGMKGLVLVAINGGTFNMDCADDAIHSNDTVIIDDGVFTIATGDDGVHADTYVEINGGTITVTDSYEGIESADVTINDGNINVTSSDDGINGAGGDGSGGPWPPQPGGSSGEEYYLHINGGYIAVYADGDGIDVNGHIVMTGGTVIVHGPTGDMNGALDYDRTFNISGGFLVAVGSAGMAQAPSTTSSQKSVKITYSQWKTAGTMIHLETTTGGADVLTFTPAKAYRSCVISSPDLQSSTSYRLYRAGSSTGTVADGLYEGGVYSPGTLSNTFTVYNAVTNVNAQ